MRSHRLLTGVVGVASVLGLAVCLGSATGQAIVFQPDGPPAVMVGGRMAQPGGKMPASKDGGTAAQLSGLKLIEDSDYRKYINAARDCIKDQSWGDACTVLQTILDKEEDSYVQVRDKDSQGRETLRWTSVKFEANHLLGSMPADGLDVYELRFGAKAQNLLEDAKGKGDIDLLGDVAQRYLHTKAGLEANDLLATHFLDRGQFFTAALRFEKLLGLNDERVKLSDLTLFKAALAYRRAGEIKSAEAVWTKLEPRLRDKGGMPMGDEVIPVAKLQQVLDTVPKADAFSPHDWPMIRGNLAHSAQAKGTPPLLDATLWTRALLLDNDGISDEKHNRDLETPAKQRVDTAITKIASLGNVPVMPGGFPIAVNKWLVYRTYTDIRAVSLTDEEEIHEGKIIKRKPGDVKWRSFPFDNVLAPLLADGAARGTVDTWIDNYLNLGGFANILYENTMVGTLSSDHRYVYAVDDIAVPPPGNLFQAQPFMQPNMMNNFPEGVRSKVLQNTLWAFDLANGKAKWLLDSRDKRFANSHFLGAPISVGGKLYVLNEKGPETTPGATGDAELRLVCIDPNVIEGSVPKVTAIQDLGMVQQAYRVTHDVSRRTNAVHLGYGEGILVCPTNAGEVLGVDLMSRSLAWAYPYREQAPQTVQVPTNLNNARQLGFIQPGMNMGMSATVANWKSAPPVIVDGKVVFTAPDASSVHCINLRDGTPVWKKRQMDGDLFLAGVWQGKVIVVGRSSIRALHLKNGDMAWYLPTGEMPSGQGVAAKNVYYLPLRKGEILAVDIDKGQVKAHNKAKRDDVPLGNLVFFEGAVIAQTPREIVAYPQLLAKLDEINTALRGDPENPERLVNRGELFLADGQVSKAVDDLHRALEKRPAPALMSRAKNALYEALTQMLQSDFNAAAPEFLDEYRTLCKVAGDEREEQERQARYFRIVAQGREAQGNLVEAFQMYRAFGSLPIHREQGGIAVLDDPMHKVPVDAWLRGRVSSMFAKATPQEREPLSKKIVEEWSAVEAKKDPNAIRSFVGMFDVAFPVGREARLRLAESIIERNDRTAFLEAELSLHQVRGDAFRRDAESGGRALAALALLEEKKGTVESMKQAAAYYRELAALFPDALVRDGKTGRKLLDELATDKRFLPFLAEPTGLWGEEKIGARELQSGHGLAALQGFSFQPEGELTPSMKRHRLILDPSNAANPVLRFVDLTTGETRWTSQLGSVPVNFQYFQYLYLQKQNANVNVNVGVRVLGARGATASRVYDPDHRYRFYQVKGHMIVFQVGTQVYCLDASTGKILWQHPLMEPPPQQAANPQMLINQVLPDADGRLELVMINQFNGQRTKLPIGTVGALQASYAALLTQKGLVVLDPLRGTTLWNKIDVPASTHLFGDDQHLFLVDAAEGAIGAGRVFRANDGAFIDARDFGPMYDNRVRVLGSRILAATPAKDQTTLRLYDILSGKDVWSKEFKGKMTVLRAEDPSLTGVIDSDTGKLTVLDAATGKQLMAGQANQFRITLDDLKNLEEPLLLADRERFYVVLNQPVDTNAVAGGVLHNNFNNGLRCLPANGWVAAFRRHDGKHRADGALEDHKAGDMAWHSGQKLENQMIVLEQFDLLPILIFSARYNEMVAGGARGSRWLLVTQSMHKATGKSIYDSGKRPAPNANAQFESLAIDLQAGAVNMLSFTNTVQHYVDDGRKVELPPGATALQGPARAPNIDIGVEMALPAGGVLPVRIQRVAPIAPPPPPIEKK